MLFLEEDVQVSALNVQRSMFMFEPCADETLISAEFPDSYPIVWRNELVEEVRLSLVVWPSISM